ncbi:hypothetical protein [Stenotrophomonas sp. PS02297]|uniref:hypothetical protein n=1 Tax=Stenotrophomonas sp. PS02297 TaxID=2991423 RepID=UPI00249CF018|nr:hypothetical protein [Stenotrophomonas sp. PS02297]
MNGQIIGASSECKPSSEVEVQLSNQQRGIDQLHEGISILERRLAIVLRPSPPTGTEGYGDAAATSSPLCSAIDSRTDQIRSAQRRIESLIDCLTT